jgi:toxin ParE1/3/4
MRIRWTPAAAADLQSVSDYLKEHHPHYREATIRRVYADIQSLKEWPHLGRVGREEGTRELLFLPLPYVAVYRVREQNIEVLRIYHGAQGRPKL